MRIIKTFESFSHEDDIDELQLIMKHRSDFDKLKITLKKSLYHVDSYNEEFLCIAFTCDGRDDCDNLELELTDLLNSLHIEDFHFESY